MLSLQAELGQLRAQRGVDGARLQRRLALEARTQFSVHAELRLAFYAAVLLIVGGAGTLVARNLARIGPMLLTGTLLCAAAICYGLAWRTRRAGRERTAGGDYLLLLGGLLLSTAAGYAEAQFHWAGPWWSTQLALLALLHALGAYYFDSRLLLSVSLTALAAWFGVETGPRALSDWSLPAAQLAWRALACALTVFFWRVYQGHAERSRGFDAVLEQAVAHLAFIGCIALALGTPAWLGAVLAVLLGLASLRWGQARRDALFIVYGAIYPLVAVDCVLLRHVRDWGLEAAIVLFSACGAALLVWRLLARLPARERA